MNVAKGKLPLRRALAKLGLLERFTAFCRAGASDPQVRRWLTERPGLLDLAHIPAKLNMLRRQIDARGPRGGPRPPGRKTYHVQR